MYPYQPMYQQIQQMQQPAIPQMQNASQNMQVQGTNQNMQMQNGGFVTVANENMAYSYPVAHGTCMTFKVEGQPIVIEKSMGFSQFESPKIDRYRLVKEEITEEKPEVQETENHWESWIEDIKTRIEIVEKELAALKAKPKPVAKKKEDTKDDSE